MSRLIRFSICALSLLFLAACGEQSPTRPLSEAEVSTAQGPATQAALEAQISGLITALYEPTAQGAVQRDFARIKAQVASNRTTEAQASVISFVQTLLGDLADGDLQDPNGAQPPSTADALASLVNAVAQFGGLPPPIPPSNPLGGDGAIAVVGPAGGTVVASSGFGGVQFPPGALPENVIVVVSRLPNPTTPNAGPLPTTFNQYPLFYDFSTTPPVAQFAQPVLVGICQLEVGQPFGPPTQLVANRLQLAHPNPANPTTVELLLREPAPFVDCAGVQLARARQLRQGEGLLASALGRIRDIGTRAAAVFRPTPLYAVHGGLGGKTTSFSPFGAVDPGIVTPLFGQLALGYEHGCAIANDAETYCWGHDGVNVGTFVGVGALGQGSIINTVSAPVKVVGGHLFTEISSHDPHTCGLLTNGTAMCWGRDNGSLGRGIPSGNIAAPAPVLGGPWSSVSAGLFLTCAIDLLNAAWCWGFNQNSNLGNPAFPGPQFSPIPVATTVQFRSISAGWLHACALTLGGASGDAYCWGSTTALGATAPPPPDVQTPTLVSSPVTFTHLAAGGIHTCGITLALVAYCWGQNGAGQLGDGTTQARTNPLPVAGNVQFVMIAASPVPNTSASAILNGGVFTCGLASTGQAYCWGDNQFGQLGDGTIVDRLTPTPVATSQVFVSIATGRDFACAMTVNREVYCWGNNSNGDLGSGVVGPPSLTPVRVLPPF